MGFYTSRAGNPDRAGEAGAYELLINGWARSSGMFSLNTATVKGLESMRLNAAGLSMVEQTEVGVSYTLWMQGTGTNIVKGGVAQKIGEGNVIGVSLMNTSFGDITRTTTQNPEGGLGTFSPNFMNIGLSYARAFSNSIHGGVVVRLINERVDDISATGFALDAGIQYVTGPRDNIHFGVAIRNIGTPMTFGGDGFVFRTQEPDAGDYNISVSQRTQKFELPSVLHIGAGYDIYFGANKSKKSVKNEEVPGEEEGEEEEGEEEEANPFNRLTIVANFTSNSFGKDNYGLGLEYSFREMFQVRVGYRMEPGMFSAETDTRAHMGLSAGVTVAVPLGDDGPRLGIVYSYRPSQPCNGTHSIGLRFTL
jgi:hypothetical protein